MERGSGRERGRASRLGFKTCNTAAFTTGSLPLRHYYCLALPQVPAAVHAEVQRQAQWHGYAARLFEYVAKNAVCSCVNALDYCPLPLFLPLFLPHAPMHVLEPCCMSFSLVCVCVCVCVCLSVCACVRA